MKQQKDLKKIISIIDNMTVTSWCDSVNINRAIFQLRYYCLIEHLGRDNLDDGGIKNKTISDFLSIIKNFTRHVDK